MSEYLQLKSGYIIPYNKNIEGIKIEEYNAAKIIKNIFTEGLIAIIATGGTILAFEKFIQAGVDVSNLNNPLYMPATEINEKLANILTIFNKKFVFYNPYSILSENLQMSHLQILYNLILKIKEKVSAIIILHGTDNIIFSSCFIFYTIKTNIPILFIGAQKSPDRPGSEYFQLLDHALKFIECKKNIKGVFNLVYSNAGITDVIQPFKLIKLDTYSRNSFKSDTLFAKITNSKIQFLSRDTSENKFILKQKYSSTLLNKVIVISVLPNLDLEFINLISTTYKLILIGTGMGHIDENLLNFINSKKIKVYISTRCLSGNTSNETYTSSRKQNQILLNNNLESNYIKILLNII